jgi:polyhydroxyalkanoate synthesis repressor PhaR
VKPGPVVVKKYPNRRLYDTSAGRYINLEDVAGLVRQGADVQVVDARTGEDLTRAVLTQVIIEDARDQPAGLPLELLRQIIVMTDRAGRDFITWYMNSAFDAYQKVQQTVEESITDVRSAALSPLTLVRNLLVPQEPGGSAPAPAARDVELEQLRQRVAELESMAAMLGSTFGIKPPDSPRPRKSKRKAV